MARTYSKQQKQALIRRTRNRLQVGAVKKFDLVSLIHRRHSDAPNYASSYDLFAWFCQRSWRGESSRSMECDPTSREFLKSYQWRVLRMQVIKERGARCECCGASPTDGFTVINVDHIKSRRTHPYLALVKSNLQVLCHVCNQGKGNWDQTDWRDPETVEHDVPIWKGGDEDEITQHVPDVRARLMVMAKEKADRLRPRLVTKK